MLRILAPRKHEKAKQYVLDFCFETCLGLEFELIFDDVETYVVTLPNNTSVRIPDLFFSKSIDELCSVNMMPDKNPKVISGSHARVGEYKKIPLIYSSFEGNRLILSSQPSELDFSFDLFGSIFFMISRLEEAIVQERDLHDRFSAKSSLAYKNGFLNRPIVDEYIELLWQLMSSACPAMKRKEHRYQVIVSHDVDVPLWHLGKTTKNVVASVFVDIFRHFELRLGLKRSLSLFGGINPNLDICFNFKKIMDLSESLQLTSSFYFIADKTSPNMDGNYNIFDPVILNLIREIKDRGHQVGIHTSYNTYKDNEQTKREFLLLADACEKAGFDTKDIGGRQHYLRWSNPETWRNWASAGARYDSTLGFADYAGFRCGTCREYRVFDIRTETVLNLWERPLVVMDGTLCDYMGLSSEQAYQTAIQLARHCHRQKGNFTLLWHNSFLVKDWQKGLYKRILQSACALK